MKTSPDKSKAKVFKLHAPPLFVHRLGLGGEEQVGAMATEPFSSALSASACCSEVPDKLDPQGAGLVRWRSWVYHKLTSLIGRRLSVGAELPVLRKQRRVGSARSRLTGGSPCQPQWAWRTRIPKPGAVLRKRGTHLARWACRTGQDLNSLAQDPRLA